VKIGRGVTLSAVLQDTLEKLLVEKDVDSLTELTKHMHLYPDLHGQLCTSATYINVVLTLALTCLCNREQVSDR
jgi:hypothetical protein